MSFVVYNNKSFKRLRSANGSETFSLQRIANSVLTKHLNKVSGNRADWTVAPYDDWCAVVPLVEVDSVMGGKIIIRADERGNPACDPSMEGHWTM